MASMQQPLLDAAGGRRSKNRGVRFLADPPTVEEIVAVMRAAGNGLTAPGCRR
jgi:hypothetical protein